jgi:hypothetical protein
MRAGGWRSSTTPNFSLEAYEPRLVSKGLIIVSSTAGKMKPLLTSPPFIKEKVMKREQPRLKKLTLNRETIVMLSEAELAKAQGGQMNTGDTYGCANSAGCTGVFC